MLRVQSPKLVECHEEAEHVDGDPERVRDVVARRALRAERAD